MILVERKVAKRVRKDSTPAKKPVHVKSAGASATGRQRQYVQRSSAFDALFLGTPHDALLYPEEGVLSLLSFNDLCVVPLLGRAFYEAMGGNVHTSERPWVQQLVAGLLPQRMPRFLEEVCTAPGRKVLQCGDGMGTIFIFKYQDRSTVEKHYAAFVPFVEGDINYMGTPWSMPYLNHGLGDAAHNHNAPAMAALHSGDWEEAARLVLNECTNGEGTLLKNLSGQRIIDCSQDRMHPEDYCRSHATLISRAFKAQRDAEAKKKK